MLTGLPPFYSDDVEEIRHNILEEQPQLSDSLPSIARELLSGLLLRDSEKRLGASGASEVKSHECFRHIDWQMLYQRAYEPTYKSSPVANQFVYYGIGFPYVSRNPWTERFGGFKYSPGTTAVALEQNQHKNSGYAPFSWFPDRKADDWELIWNETTREFTFLNRINGIQEAVQVQHAIPHALVGETALTEISCNLPTQNQMHDTFNLLMERGPDSAFWKLLELGLDLRARRPKNLAARMTPLEWAVNSPDLCFLGTFLTQSAVKHSDRIAATRALSLAVASWKDEAIYVLLTHGVCCDFEESDRPLPHDPRNDGCYFDDPSDLDSFMPPLVRAV